MTAGCVAGRAVRAVSGVLSARAGQPGLTDLVPGGGAAVDVVVLPLRSAAPSSQNRAPRQNPTPIDWLLAAVALVACLYPVLPFQIADGGGGFDEFLSGRARPGRSTSSSGRSCCCWCWRPAAGPRAPRCRSCACSPSATPTTAATCRRVRRSPMPAWTGTRSSAPRSSSRPACTECRWTSRPPTSCCSPSTARCWTRPVPASSSSTCPSPRSADRARHRAGR